MEALSKRSLPLNREFYLPGTRRAFMRGEGRRGSGPRLYFVYVSLFTLDVPLLHPSAPRPGVLHCKRSRSMTSVAQLLKSKPNQEIFTIEAADSVYDAIKLMADKQIGALIVKENGAIAGIVTERDYARKVVLMDRSSKNTPVRDIMSSAVRFVRPDQTTDDCMALMTERRMRHLPVLENDELIGMVSIGDLVKAIIAEQQFTIQQLEHYIHSS
jgi:CBS domain-containing protein